MSCGKSTGLRVRRLSLWIVVLWSEGFRFGSLLWNWGLGYCSDSQPWILRAGRHLRGHLNPPLFGVGKIEALREGLVQLHQKVAEPGPRPGYPISHTRTFPSGCSPFGHLLLSQYLSSIWTLEKWIKMLVAVTQSQLLGIISKSASLRDAGYFCVSSRVHFISVT